MPTIGLNDESIDRNDGVELFADEDGALIAVNELGVEHDHNSNRTDEHSTRSGLRGLVASLFS